MNIGRVTDATSQIIGPLRSESKRKNHPRVLEAVFLKRLFGHFHYRHSKGCIFVTFSVELDDQRPHLSKQVNTGFMGLKAMLKRLLDEGRELGELGNDVSTSAITEMLFAGMVGASVIYGVDKSTDGLDRSINTLIDYLERLKP